MNPSDAGFYDTFPANDASGFSGSWSCYPFFPSGTVIVSDTIGGLFVLNASALIGTGCQTDLDGDGHTGASDLAALLGAWGPNPGHPADFDGSGIIDVGDLAALLGGWGACGA